MRLAGIVLVGDGAAVVEVMVAEEEAGAIFVDVEEGDVGGVGGIGEELLLAEEIAESGIDDVNEEGGLLAAGFFVGRISAGGADGYVDFGGVGAGARD